MARHHVSLCVGEVCVGSGWTVANKAGKYEMSVMLGRSSSHGHTLVGVAFPEYVVSSISIEEKRYRQEFTIVPHIPMMQYSVKTTAGGYDVTFGTYDGTDAGLAFVPRSLTYSLSLASPR